ncbi:signal peptidase I [Gemmatirosa kalamazoonensis]|uniref:Signal peptidase I n=1 Tax=Gemmatirosa kalamazoonensis TaxID=861299 RepID=W0RLZ1_9BACT|nr:signal peptidase I [Gemmatirosa kalamazoonensis]
MDSSTGSAVSPTCPVDRGYATHVARAEALRRVNHVPRLRIGWLWEWAKVLQIAFLLFLVLKTFLVEAYKIPSGSMEHTLLVGDFLLVNKLVYGAEVPFTGQRLPRLRDPQRGDVLVFQWPEDPSKNFVKRLVGVPGDTLMMRDGELFVNGHAQREQYVTHTEPGVDPTFEEFRWQRDYVVRSAVAAPTSAVAGELAVATRDPGDHPSRNNWGPLIVPRGSYFVLGDNRDNSLDSRYWGFVPDSLVRGRPMVVYYSYAPDSADRLAWLRAIRWSRLGERVR